MRCTLYHGTDEKYAGDIIKNGFIVKQNRGHWLGNGVYFFTDETLAKWWTTKPSKKFGHTITDPVIIRCDFEAADDTILDLRRFDDYTYCFEHFEYFYNSMYRPFSTMEQIDINKLRCTFFDWLFDIRGYTAIVGTFVSSEQPYYETIKLADKEFKCLNLAYNEVQVCISETRQTSLTDIQMQTI